MRKRELALAAIVATTSGAACSLLPHEHHYGLPKGDIPVVITNHTRFPVCSIELDADPTEQPDAQVWVVMTDVGGQTVPPLAPNASTQVSVKPGLYRFGAGTCNHVLSGSLQVDVRQPYQMGIGGIDTAIGTNAPKSEIPMRKFGIPAPDPNAPKCRPAGDMTVNSDGCCSGRVVMSAKHPGPSHCAYDDE